MRLFRTTVLMGLLGAAAYFAAHARPDEADAGKGRLSSAVEVCPSFTPKAPQFLAVADLEKSQEVLLALIRANIPLAVAGRSVAIDGQIWASGNNFLEFHDRPSITLGVQITDFQLGPHEEGPIRWTGSFTTNVQGAVHLKKMLARIGSHNTVAVRKDGVSVAFAINLFSVANKWASGKVDLLSPTEVPVTINASLWGIGIGHPIAVPVPVGPVLEFAFDTQSAIDFSGTRFELRPVRSDAGKEHSFCVIGSLTGQKIQEAARNN
ncbi:hypothetical protein GCM10010869_13150 [Mesorhizobium tianshanense]|uniref:Uncharacterized protein n=1 Tax=Mesorhizobium tianshanense TaxID=39844 RepID=A0A562P9K2_9HYPH|nr:hypothetical protein [Mesorhizobium tianshanense]TWI41081.1 hypothetical protein IQ26_01017 [Mesorhizobium tianshanense]GLS35726.1 hypothetical protein GCM10010869_13150 [Mesorhizobium tianshanense]